MHRLRHRRGHDKRQRCDERFQRLGSDVGPMPEFAGVKNAVIDEFVKTRGTAAAALASLVG